MVKNMRRDLGWTLRKLLGHKEFVDLNALERPFSLDEIKSVVFELVGTKLLVRMAF